MLKTKLIVFPVLLISLISFGQVNDSGYHNNSNKKKGNTGYYLTRVNSFSEVARYSEEETYQINYLINEALNIYIDQSYRLTTTQLIFRKTEKEMINQMDNLVNQSLALFKIKTQFNGFSYDVVKKLVDVTSLEWGINEYLIMGDDQAERDFVLANYIGSKFEELESACHAEVNDFIQKNNIDISKDTYSNKQEELVRVSNEKYESADFIAPLEYTLDWPIAAAAYELDFVFPKSFIEGYNAYVKTSKKAGKQKKRKKDYTEELIAVIKQNSAQLSALQKDLQSYNEAGIIRDREQNYALQLQISELQNQIDEISKKVNNQGALINNNVKDKVALNKTTIQFDKNSTTLNSYGIVQLNRVFVTLIKMPKYKVIITGFADKSGNTDLNVYLSQQRAREVEKYLVALGIDTERLIVNYMGDLYSNSNNASDRKVTVEFINKVSTIDFTAK